MDTMTIIIASAIVSVTFFPIIFTVYISVIGNGKEKRESVSKTKKEAQAEIDKGQLKASMEVLINALTLKAIII